MKSVLFIGLGMICVSYAALQFLFVMRVYGYIPLMSPVRRGIFAF